MICSVDETCSSYNHQKSTKTCELVAKSSENRRSSISDSDGWMSYHPYDECDAYLIESEPDSTFSSSSHFQGNEPDDHKAKWARLNSKETRNGNGGWSASEADTSPWIQVRFSEERVVQAIVTQGRGIQPVYIQYVTEYKVEYSADCQQFHPITSDTGSYNFDGNTSVFDTVTNRFSLLVAARCIRIYPTDWSDHCSMRMEVIGCF